MRVVMAFTVIAVMLIVVQPTSSYDYVGEAPGTVLLEPTYQHIKDLINPKILESNKRAIEYLKQHPGLPHWASYEGQCDMGISSYNSRGEAICYRPRSGRAMNATMNITMSP